MLEDGYLVAPLYEGKLALRALYLIELELTRDILSVSTTLGVLSLGVVCYSSMRNSYASESIRPLSSLPI